MTSNFVENSANSLVIIGPPDAPALDQLIAGGPRRIVLIEPDADRARAFAGTVGRKEGVEVITAAIGTAGEQAELVQYNLPGLRSLHLPNAFLHQLFPGLAQRGSRKIELQPVSALLDHIGDLPEPVALWIDLPGSELDILESWAAVGDLREICQITVRCGVEVMFESGAGVQEVEGWLQERFFQQVSEDRQDPDWPVVTFRDNPLRREVARLQEMLSQKQAESEKREAELMARAGTLEAELTAKSEAFKTAQGAADRVPGLEEALGLRQDELKKAQRAASDAKQRGDDLQERLEKAQAVAKDTEATLRGKEDELKKAHGAASDAKRRGNDLQERLEKAQAVAKDTEATLRGKEEELKRVQAKIGNMQEDLTIALRMQQVALNDIQELRLRYHEAVQARDAQAALLQKLTPRLQQAARHLQELALSDDRFSLDAPAPDVAPKTRKTRTSKTAAKTTAKTAAKTTTRKRAPARAKSGERT